MAVATETLAIGLGGEQHSFPIFSFLDRRMRKPQRKQWVLVRAVERLLFGVTEGVRSTGRFALHLSKCSMAESVLVCDKAAVEEEETITQEEFEAGTSSQGSSLHAYCGLRSPPDSPAALVRSAVIAAMKTLVDPESRGRIRKASVVPITPCCSALSEFGRNDATTAMMKALNKLVRVPGSNDGGAPLRSHTLVCHSRRSGSWRLSRRPIAPISRRTWCSTPSWRRWTPRAATSTRR